MEDERRVAQPVPDRGLDDRALGHADQGTGYLERAARFAERLDLDAGPIVRVGAERAGAELELEGEDAVAQPAGGDAVGVGDDALDRWRDPPAARPLPGSRRDREQTEGNRETSGHGHGWPRGGRGGIGAGSVGGARVNLVAALDRVTPALSDGGIACGRCQARGRG